MEDYLEHYGIRGMKWGVRNAETRARYAHEGRSGKRQAKKEARAARKAETAKIKQIKAERNAANRRRSLLSNEELDRRIKRLEKEKRLRELTTSEVNAGRTQAIKTLDSYGKTALRAVIGIGTGGVKEGAKDVIKSETVSYINKKRRNKE